MNKPVTITLTVKEPIKKVTSAYCGELKATTTNGVTTVTVPKLWYGDMLRFDF